MGIATALAAGAVVAAGTVAGAVVSANAQNKAGQAQADAAQNQVQLAQWGVQQQIAERAKAVDQASKVSAASPGEISSINQILSTKMSALNSSLSSISKQQSDLDKVDPQVQAAGNDLYNLLTGHASDILAPMQTQRDNQRKQLVNSLQSQMGPGYATSTAGIQALTAFDQDTASVLSNAQLNAVQVATNTYSTTGSLQQQGQNAITSQTANAFGAAMGADQSVLQANQFITNRQTNAFLNAQGTNQINYGAPAAAQGSVVATAGAPYAGTSYLGGAISGAAGQIGGAALGAYQNSQLVGALQNMGGSSPGAPGGTPNAFQTGASDSSMATYTPAGSGNVFGPPSSLAGNNFSGGG